MEKNNNMKDPFEGLSVSQIDGIYATLARGNGEKAAKDWMDKLEAGVDKHIDEYKKQSDSNSKVDKK